MIDILDLVRASNTIALIMAGLVLIGAGMVLHYDIKKHSRNGVSHALRNLLYASAALMLSSAAFPIWVFFRGSVSNYEQVVTLLYCVRLASLIAMSLYTYHLVRAMLCANSGEC